MLRFLTIGAFALLFTSQAAAQDVYRVSEDVTAPKVLVLAKPAYTPKAMLKRIEGTVELEVDVKPDGTVGTVALVKSLDPELDKEAATAARKSTFTPGTKDGMPVTVRTVITLEFNMR
jgi:TonB family protein